MRHVREFIDEERKLAELREILDDRVSSFELEIRRDGHEVAVAHALAVAVDRALHLRAPA